MRMKGVLWKQIDGRVAIERSTEVRISTLVTLLRTRWLYCLSMLDDRFPFFATLKFLLRLS
jgi:hypothetical protein